MKYAENISDIINAFSPDPLNIEQLDKFYYDNTMKCRTGDEYASPMEDIFDDCTDEQSPNAFLLLGHRGCGKSTELNKLSKKFKTEGYCIKTINCSIDLDLLNIVHSDLFILMGEALLEIANECHCKIDKGIQKHIKDFWLEGTKILTKTKENLKEIDAGISAEIPKLLAKIFASIKTDLKFNTETREEYREEIKTCSSEWITLLNDISKENGKKEKIENKEKLLKMLQATVALEYNGKRWYNVHPLVVEFFKEQRLI